MVRLLEWEVGGGRKRAGGVMDFLAGNEKPVLSIHHTIPYHTHLIQHPTMKAFVYLFLMLQASYSTA
jgi:hypothetical protein